MDISVASAPSGSADLTVHVLRAGDEPPEGVPSGAIEDAADEPILLYAEDRRGGIVVVTSDSKDHEAFRMAGAQSASLARRVRAQSVIINGPAKLGEAEASALVEGFVLGSYRFSEYTDGSAATPDVESLTLSGFGVDGAHSAMRVAQLSAEAACYARDLVNRSPHDKTAPLLAREAQRMAAEVGLRCEVWSRARIEAERMGGLLAVNRGSVEPPRFVVLEHAPSGTEEQRPIVLVGKAVVFDTGGLSLKPTKDSMDKMKADMSGAAAVIGAMRGAALTDLPRRVVALIPMTDNRPGGDAYVPGDVVRMRNGLSVEVLNTDAEGRMLLADALDLARDYEPELVIDVATLTGAAVIALGSRVAAVLTPQDDATDGRLARFVSAGRRTGEWVHPLPMLDHYAEQLKSDVADLKNVGGKEAGTITAAKFLERFTRVDDEPAYPWVHLDIAGPAFTASPQPYRPVGGTGFGVRLLLEVLRDQSR